MIRGITPGVLSVDMQAYVESVHGLVSIKCEAKDASLADEYLNAVEKIATEIETRLEELPVDSYIELRETLETFVEASTTLVCLAINNIDRANEDAYARLKAARARIEEVRNMVSSTYDTEALKAFNFNLSYSRFGMPMLLARMHSTGMLDEDSLRTLFKELTPKLCYLIRFYAGNVSSLPQEKGGVLFSIIHGDDTFLTATYRLGELQLLHPSVESAMVNNAISEMADEIIKANILPTEYRKS